MLKPDRLDRYLPLVFPSGVKVSTFAKHCPQCKTLAKAGHMHGVALMVVDRAFILARGTCPQCRHEFEVKCMFEDNKQVHPVMLPTWLMRLLLNWHARQLHKRGMPLKPEAKTAGSDSQSADNIAHIPSGLILQSADPAVRLASEQLGRFLDQPIPAWVEYRGQRFDFARTIAPASQPRLAADELLLDRHLVYKPGLHAIA